AREEDWVEHLYTAATHDYLMVFTARGHCYWLKVHEIPTASRTARGRPLVNLLSLGPDERVAAIVPVREFDPALNLMFATRRGTVKQTSLAAYRHVRVTGVNAINIEEGDELIAVQITTGSDHVVLATRDGMAIRFDERDVREMGRVATGVRGIRLRGNDVVIGMVVSRTDGPGRATLLVVSEHGRGKRTDIEEYRLQTRGGQGVINFRVNDATGKVVAIKAVYPGDELMMITRNGIVNRQRVDEIRVIGRATQGVRVMRMDEGDTIVDVARVVPEDDSTLPSTNGRQASTEGLDVPEPDYIDEPDAAFVDGIEASAYDASAPLSEADGAAHGVEEDGTNDERAGLGRSDPCCGRPPPRRGRPDAAAPRAVARRRARRGGATQVRKPAARRRGQDPRCLQRGSVTDGRGARARRDRVLVRQSRAGRGARRTAVRRPRGRRDAHDRTTREGGRRASPGRGGRARGNDVRGASDTRGGDRRRAGAHDRSGLRRRAHHRRAGNRRAGDRGGLAVRGRRARAGRWGRADQRHCCISPADASGLPHHRRRARAGQRDAAVHPCRSSRYDPAASYRCGRTHARAARRPHRRACTEVRGRGRHRQ